MVVLFISVFVPLTLYFGLPPFIRKLTGKKAKQTVLLLIACGVFFISWYLPSPLIDGEDTSFTTHFIGGGVFCGLLWLYLKEALNWRPKHSIIAGSASLFALVCTLGVFNEIFEFIAVKIGLLHMTLADTSWDLIANTLGALTFYLVYFIIHRTIENK